MKAQTNRLACIDALRGTAALLVLIYHSRAICWIGMNEFISRYHHWTWDPIVWCGWLTTPFRFGFLGVQLLFVISGYCIHRNQAKNIANSGVSKIDWPHYAFRRMWRIYPTYVAALIVSGLILYQLLPWLQAHGYGNPAPSEGGHSWYVFGMTLATMQDIFAPPYEGVFWSLSIEVHFYIVYPLILWINQRFGSRSMLIFTLAAGLLHISLNMLFGDWLVFRLTHFMPYWFTWCVGAYVADLEFGRAPKIRMPVWLWIVVAVMGVAAATIGFSGAAGGRYRYLGSFAEFLLAIAIGYILFVSLKPNLTSFWNHRLVRCLAWVGVFSYSLYATHVPILEVMANLYGARPVTILPSIGACIIAIGFAFLFFLTVERWSLTLPSIFVFKKRTESTQAVTVTPFTESLGSEAKTPSRS